jgi:molybdate transport system substrate-binding protein
MPKIAAVTAAACGLLVALGHSLDARAADIKLIAGNGFAPVLVEFVPQFERATGHKLAIQYGVGGAIRRQIESGEAFDLVIMPGAEPFDELIKQGKIDPNTRKELGRLGMAVGTRVGAPKPDISSVDAFKSALLKAKSLTYAPEGATGVHLAAVLERLGIAEQARAKTIPQKGAQQIAQAVAKGEAELGFAVTTVILSDPGVQLVGLFPPELQSYVAFVAGIPALAKEIDPARSLIKELSTPSTAALMKAKGFEPVGK